MRKIRLLVVMVVILGGCAGGDSQSAETGEELSPRTVRGKATIGLDEPDVNDAVFKAKLVEYNGALDETSRNVVDEIEEPEISHQEGLTKQWGFKLTAPSYDPDMKYFVRGAIYPTTTASDPLFTDECDLDLTVCEVLIEGTAASYDLNLVAVE